MVVFGFVILALGLGGFKIRDWHADRRVRRYFGVAVGDPNFENLRRFEARWVTVGSWFCILLGTWGVVTGIATGRWFSS
jgi:hypothetical protein